MSFDPDSKSDSAGAISTSAIENEIATYRAINPLAVFSLIFGVFSFLCFASPYFYVIGAAAIVTGFLAARAIHRMPDLYTGRFFAQAGVTLGIAFTSMALTTMIYSTWFRAREAKAFGLVLEKVISQGTDEEIIWFTVAPEGRKGRTAKDVAEQMQKGSRESMMFRQQNAGLFDLKTLVNAPGGELHFDYIESTDEDGKNLYAGAIYKVHFPDPKTSKEKEEYALAIIKASKEEGDYAWWLEKVQFPYKVGSHVTTPAPVDDGHGHGGH